MAPNPIRWRLAVSLAIRCRFAPSLVVFEVAPGFVQSTKAVLVEHYPKLGSVVRPPPRWLLVVRLRWKATLVWLV